MACAGVVPAVGAPVGQGKVVYVGSSNFAGWDIATVVLAWLLHNPAVTAPIIGARDVRRELLAACQSAIMLWTCGILLGAWKTGFPG